MIKTALQDIILCVKKSKGGTLIENKIKYFLLKIKQSIYFKLEMASKALPNIRNTKYFFDEKTYLEI